MSLCAVLKYHFIMKVSFLFALAALSASMETTAQSIVPEDLVCAGNMVDEDVIMLAQVLAADGTDVQRNVDTGPFGFRHSPSDACDLIDTPQLPWTFTLPEDGGCLILEDCCVVGDRFEVRDFGTPFGTTSDPSSGSLSVGEFQLRGGEHSIEVVTVEQCCGGLLAFGEITTDLSRCRDDLDPYEPAVGDCDCALSTFFAHESEGGRFRSTPIGPIEEGGCVENVESMGFTIGSLGDCSRDDVYVALYGPDFSNWREDGLEESAPFALNGNRGSDNYRIRGKARREGDYTLFAVVRGKPETAVMRKFEIKDSCTI